MSKKINFRKLSYFEEKKEKEKNSIKYRNVVNDMSLLLEKPNKNYPLTKNLANFLDKRKNNDFEPIDTDQKKQNYIIETDDKIKMVDNLIQFEPIIKPPQNFLPVETISKKNNNDLYDKTINILLNVNLKLNVIN